MMLWADADTLSARAALKQVWDDNYNRNPGPSSERISIASLSAALNASVQRQDFSVRAGLSDYRHNQRDYLNATTYQIGAGWRGKIGGNTGFRLSWNRGDRLVERDDFGGRDVITYDNRTGEVSFRVHPRWSLVAGVRDAEQTHSNDQREALDFEEEEVSGGLRFRSEKGSEITFRLVGGERHYPRAATGSGLPGSVSDLDYDYREAELEADWKASSKTRLTATLAYFDREGGENDGSGAEAGLGSEWQASDKTTLTLNYTLRQPAVGEESETPTDSHRLALAADWQWTPKILLATDARMARQEFDGRFSRVERTETTYGWTPLKVRYNITRTFSTDLSTAWLRRDSPVPDRDYKALVATLGLEAAF